MSNYDVSYVFKIMDKFSPAIKEMRKSLGEFQEGLEKVEKKIKHTDNSFKQMTHSISESGKNLTKYVTAPLAAVGTYALKNASEFKMATLTIQAFVGDAQTATKIMEDIKRQSMQTPVSVGELSKAATALLSTGTSAADVSKHLEQMNVMSIATGQDLVSLTTRMSRFHAIGSASPRAFARIMPALIQEMRKMGEQAGLSKKQMDQFLGSRGQLKSWGMFQDAINQLTKKGGAFWDVFIAKSNVWDSVVKEIHNDIVIMSAALGDVLLDFFGIDGAAMTIGQKFGRLAEKFSDFLEGHKTLVGIVLEFAALSALLGPILMATSSILNIMISLSAVTTATAVSFGIIGGSLAIIGAGIYYIYKNWEKFRDLVAETWDFVKNIVNFLSQLAGLHPIFEINSNMDQKQLAGLHAPVATNGGQLSFAPVTHNVKSTLDVNINAPAGVVKNARAGGSSDVKFNLGSNMAVARGHV